MEHFFGPLNFCKHFLFFQAKYALVSQELYPKLLNILPDLPELKTIIVFEEPHKGPVRPLPDESECKLYTFEEVVQIGYEAEVSLKAFCNPPTPLSLHFLLS